ncbi:Dor1-domain-containing protein [Rhizodiscina lignyota]|uniref:Conserved oligomeric Golgi complex subunit 8 n=1 Tax=Rhizodiscina lignyota TaxID=1504668 RepID=A0A9P4I8Y6_9PEZI|nr:Dor1-domain-containing protein [Rhizodiscina lignyota]
MADPLYELLIPYFDAEDASQLLQLDSQDPITSTYLNRLGTLTLSALTTTESQSLSQTSQSTLRSIQALSKRSYKPIISSTEKLDQLGLHLRTIASSSTSIHDALPSLEDSAQSFAQKYSKTLDNPILDRRKAALLLSRNVDRVSDVLDLPTLLSTAISSSSAAASSGAPATGTTSTNLNYASALDLHAHIKRLHTIYPNMGLINDISRQAEQEMKGMTTALIASLQGQVLKLAGAMRTIGWLRRVAPELDDAYVNSRQRSASLATSGEGSLGALFLVCRLVNLLSMLEALDPLKELADQETTRRKGRVTKGSGKSADARDGWAGGQQTERYLKRYIEIFREQSFAIMSMYKSIFPSALPAPGSSMEQEDTVLSPTSLPPRSASALKTDANEDEAALQKLPSPLATFPMHLVELLMDTLREYLPNIQDRNSRESLLTQVLYCAGSLGRLGADFGAALALLLAEDEDDEEDDYDEWAEVVKKHRIQASRLELLASGVGSGRTGSLKSPVPAQ